MYQISLKFENLDFTLFEIIEILRNSGKNPLKFDEKLRKICCLLTKSTKIISNFAKNGAKVLKNHRNLEWCKGKNVELEKR